MDIWKFPHAVRYKTRTIGYHFSTDRPSHVHDIRDKPHDQGDLEHTDRPKTVLELAHMLVGSAEIDGGDLSLAARPLETPHATYNEIASRDRPARCRKLV